LVFIFITLQLDADNWQKILMADSHPELIADTLKFYSKYSFSLFFWVVIYEYILSVFVITYTHHPIKHQWIAQLKTLGKAWVVVGTGMYGYAYGPSEPNGVSRFVHLNFPGGRGFDYNSFIDRVRGDLIKGFLGSETFFEAVKKYGSLDGIIDESALNRIVRDPEYYKKITKTNYNMLDRDLMRLPVFEPRELDPEPKETMLKITWKKLKSYVIK
jgi:hypothetical protein